MAASSSEKLSVEAHLLSHVEILRDVEDTDEEMISNEVEESDEEEESESESDTDAEVGSLEKLTRDEELGDALVEQELEQWGRFLKLSPEEALLSTKGMQEVLDIANAVSPWFQLDEEVWESLSGIEDGIALLLAILGRGDSQCSKLSLLRPVEARQAIALCANLKSNSKVQVLDVRYILIFGTPQICGVLSDALATNKTLTALHIPAVGMTPVSLRCLLFGGRRRSSWHPTKIETHLAALEACPRSYSGDYRAIVKLQNKLKKEVEKLERGGLMANMTLEQLEIGYNKLFDATALEVFLSRNSTLKRLHARRTDLNFLGARGIAAGLKCNTTLEELDLKDGAIGYDGMELICKSLSQNITETGTKKQSNTTLKKLKIGSNLIHYSQISLAVAALASMLETNTSLVHLSLLKIHFTPEHWMQQILPALSKNKTLKDLDLRGSDGLGVGEVQQAFLEMVTHNSTGLEEIQLHGTGMDKWQGRIVDEFKKNRDYRDVLRRHSMVIPTSGRLVLCGYEFAGKTTIRNTMGRIVNPKTPTEDPFQTAWKRFLKRVPCIREILYGGDAPRELEERTRGFDISLIENGPPKISVWDFAGQREYYALHDYLFPDVKNSCFIYVCSCRCPPSNQSKIGAIKSLYKIKEEFHFWMRFIASNSLVTPRPSDDGDKTHLPYVHFVLTNTDTLYLGQNSDSAQWARCVLDDLRAGFQGVLEFCETISIVNAHSADDVQRLMNNMNLKLQEILNGPSEYTICKEVRAALEEWSEQNPSNPLMSLQQYQSICDDSIRKRRGALGLQMDISLNNPSFQKAILAYLNDAGDIIYPKGFDYIVVNPRWFGICILGQLIDIGRGARSTWNGILGHPKPKSKVYHENGFVSRSNVRELVGDSLKSLKMQDAISDDTLIKLMMKLEMWYEEEPENPQSRLFFPALFDDGTDSATKGERKLNWSLDQGILYLGRRLQCAHTTTTFLTPGFFPRLQVFLVNYLRKDDVVDKSQMKVYQNLIELTQNGKQIFVEYSGDIGYFIDILVRSSKPWEETLEFISNHLVRKIRDFCASAQGCQGVILEEAVIKPLCVQELDVCAARQGHSVLVSTLERKIQKEGQSYQHHWQRIRNESCIDYALDLLKGKGSFSAPSSGSAAPGSGHGDGKQNSSAKDRLPEYYVSVKDIGFQSKVNAWKGLTPFKLHVDCDGEERSSGCTIAGQPGRDIALDNAEHGLDFSLLKPVVKFLWGKFGPGISIDTWINKAFDRNNIPIITKMELEELINSGRSLSPVSEDDLVQELEDHIARTPGRLKKILNVDDEENFWNDFRLSRVEYSTPAGKIGWLCREHLSMAHRRNILKKNTKRRT